MQCSYNKNASVIPQEVLELEDLPTLQYLHQAPIGCGLSWEGAATQGHVLSLFSWELSVITNHDSFRNVTFDCGGWSGLPTTVSAVGSWCQVKQCFWAFLFLWPKRRSCVSCLLRSLRAWAFRESEDGGTKELSNWIYLFLTDTEMEALRDGVVLIRLN